MSAAGGLRLILYGIMNLKIPYHIEKVGSKSMNINQQEAAQINMLEWLADPRELGKQPYKIECTGNFTLHEMQYYIFRFKTRVLGQWLVGVSGGYEGDSLEPCGHTFSDMKKYNATTAQNDCIEMIERIRAYWMEQAKHYTQQ